MSAPTVTPQSYLNGYTFSTSDHLVKFGTQSGTTYKVIPELTDAEADAATGDIRKLYWGLCQMMYQSANFIPDSSNPIGNLDNPRAEYDTDSTDTTILANRKSSVMTTTTYTTTDQGNDLTLSSPTYQTFTFTFKVVPTAIEVASEG